MVKLSPSRRSDEHVTGAYFAEPLIVPLMVFFFRCPALPGGKHPALSLLSIQTSRRGALNRGDLVGVWSASGLSALFFELPS